MQVKQGKINLHLEEDTNGYCHIVDMNVKVYPNTTLDEFVQLLNISGSTLTYTEPLTVI